MIPQATLGYFTYKKQNSPILLCHPGFCLRSQAIAQLILESASQ